MKKILLIPSLLTVGLMPMVSITACNNPVDPDPDPTPTDPVSVSLNETTLSLNKGETFELKATVWPEGATCSLEWTSSDNNIATVDSNGVVTAQRDGDAMITVKAIGFEKVKAICVVQVKELVDNYLTVTALEETTFITYGASMYGGDATFQYSLDNGKWINFESWKDRFSIIVTIPMNSTLRLRGFNLEGELSPIEGISFYFDGKVILSGNIMSLIDGTGSITDIPYPGGFSSLFQVFNLPEFAPYHDSIISAEELILPDTDLTGARGCYYCMFAGCTSLVKGPRLPAKTLSDICYEGMFHGCSSLREIKLDYDGGFAEAGDRCFDLWVRDIPTTGGTFYYNGNDITYGESAIPGTDNTNHWDVVKF